MFLSQTRMRLLLKTFTKTKEGTVALPMIGHKDKEIGDGEVNAIHRLGVRTRDMQLSD